MLTAAATSYDEVPYPSLSYAQSHPGRLATVARLMGLTTAPIERCRVLELGCAAGGNLLPMAYYLPESQFVGLDLSGQQIAQGQQQIAALDLKNVTLHPMNILEVTPDWGQFDYIIAHGIYSWVPSEVRDKLLQICRQNLAPQGVAYLSYNTFPGWHMFSHIRGMMLYHIRKTQDPQQKVPQAREFLDFLREAVPAEESYQGSLFAMYHQFISGETNGAGPKHDAFLLHDELEEVNDPVYFYQFVEHANRHGLQYLAEAEFSSMFPHKFSPKTVQALRRMSSSVVELEQYLDFLRNRTFRQTLICHQEISLGRERGLEALLNFHIASRARPAEDTPDIFSEAIERFQAPNGAVLTTNHPVTKAAVLNLRKQWPQTIPFNQLLMESRAMIEAQPNAVQEKWENDQRLLAANLFQAYGYSDQLLELHAHALPSFTVQVGERPLASPITRFQARQTQIITNARHERVNVDPFDCCLLQALDGQRDHSALVDTFMTGPIASGQVHLKQAETPTAEACAREIDYRLRWLARAALLIN